MTAQYAVLSAAFMGVVAGLVIIVGVTAAARRAWLARPTPGVRRAASDRHLGLVSEDAIGHFHRPVGLHREVTHDCRLPSLLALTGAYRFFCPVCHSAFEAASGDRTWTLHQRRGVQWVQVDVDHARPGVCGETGTAS